MFVTMGEVAIRPDRLARALLGDREEQIALAKLFNGVELYEHALSWSEVPGEEAVIVHAEVFEEILPPGYYMSLVISIKGPSLTSDATAARKMA